MARSRPSLGFFGKFGRSEDLRALDQALRAFDLHPSLVPDAVKLTLLNLLKDAKGEEPSHEHYGEAAALLAYCATGRDAFVGSNGEMAANMMERRIETALNQGRGFDAELILLALHSALIHPSVKDAYALEVG